MGISVIAYLKGVYIGGMLGDIFFSNGKLNGRIKISILGIVLDPLLALFSFLTTFLIFWSIRDYFNPIEMLRYTPHNFFGYIFLAVFTLIIMGTIYSGLLYFFHKYRASAPYRAETQMYRKYKKEFTKSNPKNSYNNKTNRLIALGEFLEAKKRTLPFTRH